MIAKYKEDKRNYSNGSWTESLVISPDVIASKWLGFSGSSEIDIVAVENRLGVNLTPSYWRFLKVTNGWHGYPDTIRLRSRDSKSRICRFTRNNCQVTPNHRQSIISYLSS